MKPKLKTAFTLKSLIAWLKKQPADRPYEYTDPYNCALCQYFAAMGFEKPSISMNDMDYGAHGEHWTEFPESFREISVERPRTFGAALERAQAKLR